MRAILMSDYDNTFFTSEKEVIRNIDTIKQFRNSGGCFAIVTGRNFNSIKKEIKKYDISYDYLSCVDGSTLFDSKDELIKHYLMNYEACHMIKEILDSKADMEMSIYREQAAPNSLNNVIQCFYDVTNYNHTEELFELVNSVIPYYNMNSVILDFGIDKFIIINSGTTSKAVSGYDIADFEGISYKNIYAIGDHCNDVSMVSAFNGYAMKHATNELKEVSTGLYDSVSDLALDIMTRKLSLK